jgi:hypothetical protein
MAVETINHSSIASKWKKLETLMDPSGRPLSKRHVGLQLLSSFLFDQTFSQLANIDFDRALRLTQLIEMKEARVFAQLGVCGGALR